MIRYDMVWYNMIYDISTLQMSFHLVAVVRKLVPNWENGRWIQNEKQYTTQYNNTKHITSKIESKQKKKKINKKKMLNNLSQVIRKN